MAWLMATKLEMTRVIKDDKFIPITLLKVPELKVVWFKTMEKDWYKAIIVGILNKDSQWVLKEGNVTMSKNDFSEIREFDVTDEESKKYSVWDTIWLDIIETWMLVWIKWTSKWKWFAWAMKRHNFHGWPAWHGSKFHRALGSIGNRKPTRTHKWKKMHGHMGNATVSLRNIPIELVNADMSVVGVRWGIPWARNSLVNIIF